VRKKRQLRNEVGKKELQTMNGRSSSGSHLAQVATCRSIQAMMIESGSFFIYSSLLVLRVSRIRSTTRERFELRSEMKL